MRVDHISKKWLDEPPLKGINIAELKQMLIQDLSEAAESQGCFLSKDE